MVFYHRVYPALVPVTPAIEVARTELITAGQKGRGIELAQDGFA